MKKALPILLISVMIFAMVVTPVNAGRGLKLEAEYGTPVIDGKIDDIWGESAAIVDLPHNGDKKGSSDTATVKALWDEDGFYFLVIAKDSSLEEKECFEFYVDEKFDKSEVFNKYDRQSRIYVKTGEILDSTKDEDGNDTSRKDLYVKSAYTTTSDGWILESAFKWSGLVKIEAGMVLGCEFMWDDQGAGLALRWNVDTNGGDTAPYKSTKDFGEFILKEEVVEIIEETEAAAAEAPKSEAPKAAKTADPITLAAVALVAVMGTGVVLGKKRK